MIIKAPIRQPDIPGTNKIKRDPATNLPLDDEGRYAQQISVDGETHAPKYFPCPTASAGCGGQNLDMSDPGTVAYVRALEKKIFDDIGKGTTVALLVRPVGGIGLFAGSLGTLMSVASGFVDGTPVSALAKEAIAKTATAYLKNVYGLSEIAANRITALVDLSGGWQIFIDRSKEKYNENYEEKN